MFNSKKATRLIEKVKFDSKNKSNNVINQIQHLYEDSKYYTKLNEIELQIKIVIDNRK